MKIAIVFLVLMTSSVSTEASFVDMIKNFGKKIQNSVHHVLGKTKERDDGKPSFCHELDCPEFKTVQTFTFGDDDETIEERCYPKTRWARTETTSTAETIRFGSMFKKLFNYIQGENDKKEKIEMTAPVLVNVKSNKKDDTTYMNMNFYVPPSDYATLPAPTNKDVKIADQAEMCVYVYHYGGWQMSYDQKMKDNINTLKSGLKENGLDSSVDDSVGFFYAGYDSPWRLFNRRNEVMLLKKSPKAAVQ